MESTFWECITFSHIDYLGTTYVGAPLDPVVAVMWTFLESPT